MSKATRYDEFRIEEREHTPPVVIDRNGHERVTTKVERMLWELVMRDDDKARIVAKDARIAELEKALHAIRAEAGSHTVSLSIKPQPGAGHVYVFDLASKALGL